MLCNHSSTARTILFVHILLIAATLLSLSANVWAQNPNYESERQRAFQLLDQSKMLQALPILEKLASANPDDREVQFYLGFCILAKAAEIQDVAARKQERLRARPYLVHAKELGMKEAVLDQMLASIPPDGGEMPKFSNNAEAELAMNQGESAYARGELENALAAYARALQLDPKLYYAALFAGDMQFKRGHNATNSAERSAFFNSAGEWFTKAIAIDADKETAYRYWGDAQLEQGKDDEALTKFIEAIVSDPYNRIVYNGISKWAQKKRAHLGHPRIDIPTSASSSQKGQVDITIDPKMLNKKDDGSSAWLLYSVTRALWMSERFKKTFPDEKEYRHSLAEEMDALTGVAKQAIWLLENKKAKELDVSLDNLVKLHKAGLLEPYILFARVDEGVARDYVAYRITNRDKLRKYWLEVVIQN